MIDPFACDPVPEHELAERRRNALAQAEARGLDGLLIWSRCGEPGGSADIQYFANHFSPFPWVPPASPAITACEHAAMVLKTSGAGGLAVSGYSSPKITLEDVRSGMDLDALTSAMLSDYGLSGGRVGVIGAGVLPYSSAQALQAAAPGLELVDVDDISHALRRRLSEWEIGVLRAAGRLGVELTSTLTENATPGGTEGTAVGAALARAATVPGCVHWAFLVDRGTKPTRSSRPTSRRGGPGTPTGQTTYCTSTATECSTGIRTTSHEPWCSGTQRRHSSAPSTARRDFVRRWQTSSNTGSPAADFTARGSNISQTRA